MSIDLLERWVFSKPYFDRQGLIVAVDGQDPVGFVHAGFGSNAQGTTLCTEAGATCMLMVAPHEQPSELAPPLLAQSERYLTQRGAKTLYGGGVHPVDPYYLGLYGGSEMPGLLASDETLLAVYEQAGYEIVQQRGIWHRQLAGFRPTVDRTQMTFRRAYSISALIDPPSQSWWEACTFGQVERTAFRLFSRKSQDDLRGNVVFWDLEPLASSWGVHAMGLSELHLEPADDSPELAIFLISEAFRQLQSQGVTVVEVQFDDQDQAQRELYERLGFEKTEASFVLKKSLA